MKMRLLEIDERDIKKPIKFLRNCLQVSEMELILISVFTTYVEFSKLLIIIF